MSHKRTVERRQKLFRLARVFVWVRFTPQKAEHNGHWRKFDRKKTEKFLDSLGT